MRSPPPWLKAARPPPQEGGKYFKNQKDTSLLRGRSRSFVRGWGRAIGTNAAL